MMKTGRRAVRLPRQGYGKDDVIEVKTRIIHPNHNGRHKYEDKGYIARHFINVIEVYYGDQRIISMDASAGLSQNPYFTFALKATHTAPLRVVWKDTSGEEYSETVDIRV
jgi:sulfur-oxidizing protein SoxZ